MVAREVPTVFNETANSIYRSMRKSYSSCTDKLTANNDNKWWAQWQGQSMRDFPRQTNKRTRREIVIKRKKKFIAFINALLTLAYCMTNCFRKPSTKVIPLCRFPENVFLLFSVTLKENPFVLKWFNVARSARRDPWVPYISEFIWQSQNERDSSRVETHNGICLQTNYHSSTAWKHNGSDDFS